MPTNWTDARVVALLLLPAIAAVLWMTSLAADNGVAQADPVEAGPVEAGPVEEAPVRAGASIPVLEASEPHESSVDDATGTAAWATDLLSELATYEGEPAERYDRDTYDVGWLDADGDCQSGRHEVLIAESLSPVELDDEACRVQRGRWVDPYEGVVVTAANEASIDHVVSLADAHRSGGWRWPHQWRVAFGNDIDDPATLAVSATDVNSAKGSAPPDGWLPADDDARCRYAIAWVRVKTRWQLAVTDAERLALDEALTSCIEAGLPTEVESRPLSVIDFDATPPEWTTRDRATQLDTSVCDGRYEAVCIPLADGDLDCADVEPRRFTVTTDPHGFDGDDNGIGCEFIPDED